MTRPLGNFIQIKPDDTEETTSGGIIRASKPVPNEGTVVGVSEEADTTLAVGDKVRYLPNGRVDNEDGTILIKEENILFVINEAN